MHDIKSVDLIRQALSREFGTQRLKDVSNLLSVKNPEIIKEMALSEPKLIIQLK